MTQVYDLILVGTGPAALFFLHGYLKRASENARILVLEKGLDRDHAWQLAQGPGGYARQSARHVNFSGKKKWRMAIGLGGGSNIWRGAAPRMLPEDFHLRSSYGVGRDWPLSYAQLEPHYCEAETIMKVAGDSERSPAPRSQPYPQTAHPFTEPESILAAAHPDAFFHLPCARPHHTTPHRVACCASGVCTLCPTDSKFSVLNEMRPQLLDPRVELQLGATVQSLETAAGSVTGVHYGLASGLPESSQPAFARAELVALAANAIFNPHILLRSNLDDDVVGRGLYEPASLKVLVYLDGVDNYGSSTSTTGHGYMLYPGPHRKKRAAALLETWNSPPRLRLEAGKWRQLLRLQMIIEDLPQSENRVTIDPDDVNSPKVVSGKRSAYLTRTQERAKSDLERVLSALPIEKIKVAKTFRSSEGHALGTTPMGLHVEDSVVDATLRHHRLRNLLVLGGSTFPVSGPANSTLTIAALSLHAAASL